MKKDYIGKILIGVGITLIAIPLLITIIYDFSSFIGNGKLARSIGQNLLGGSISNANIFSRWLGSIIFTSFRLNNIQMFFQSIFFHNVFWLFLPNIFILSGFCFLLKYNKNIDIKESFNKIVIVGLVINILVLFNFFGLYNIVYNRFRMSRWLSFLPRNILYSSVGMFIYKFSRLIVNLLFRLILVAPTFAIFAGYMQFFRKQEITSAVNENTISEKLQNSVPVASPSFGNLSLSKMMLEFKGGVLPIFLFPFWFVPFMGITFGLALPWIICIVIRWICENTTIGGKQLAFHGTGGGLFGRYILWTILTFITLGIYGYWATRNYIRWAIENIEVSLPKFSSEVNSNNITYTPPINRNYGETWTCKKCSEENPIASSSCKGCGAYK